MRLHEGKSHADAARRHSTDSYGANLGAFERAISLFSGAIQM
jgi:hypothetical protein